MRPGAFPRDYTPTTRQVRGGWIAVCECVYHTGDTSQVNEPTDPRTGKLPIYETDAEALAAAIALCGEYRQRDRKLRQR